MASASSASSTSGLPRHKRLRFDDYVQSDTVHQLATAVGSGAIRAKNGQLIGSRLVAGACFLFVCEFVVNSVHQRFAFKASHVSEVVGLARTIAKEFCVPVNSELAGFASLSSDTHCERDLHVWLRGAYDINMEVTHVPIDVYDKHWKEVRVQHPILLPCDLARELWAAGDSVFESSMVGKAGAGGLNKFWQQVSKLGCIHICRIPLCVQAKFQSFYMAMELVHLKCRS